LGAALALGLAACGGKDKPAESPASASATSEQGQDTGDEVVGPETMDEIRRALDRKRNVVARCLAPAIEAGELPKNARGRVTLGLVISPAGRATDVTVIKSSLDSEVLRSCVIERVQEIEFPTVPQPLPWSYTYGFEAV
jgi:hypothetical protein